MFELAIAERHILGNPKMVLFTVLSVALAVGVIFVMIGLMDGYRENLIEDTVENAAHVTVDPKEDEDYIYLYRTLTAIAREDPLVVAASPRIIGNAAAKYKDNVEGVTFVGADPVQEDLLLKVQDDLVWGDYYDLRFKRFAAVVGDNLADDLELKWGDDFQLIRGSASIRVKAVGIIDTGTSLDSTLVYLPLETAQDLLGEGDVVSEVGMRLSDIYAAPAVAA
ncbi:MAG TPA: ABC transporter permease, partial [Methanothrix sp.]|nr:ABC transporter permease [Methanothrix sp.]